MKNLNTWQVTIIVVLAVCFACSAYGWRALHQTTERAKIEDVSEDTVENFEARFAAIAGDKRAMAAAFLGHVLIDTPLAADVTAECSQALLEADWTDENTEVVTARSLREGLGVTLAAPVARTTNDSDYSVVETGATPHSFLLKWEASLEATPRGYCFRIKCGNDKWHSVDDWEKHDERLQASVKNTEYLAVLVGNDLEYDSKTAAVKRVEATAFLYRFSDASCLGRFRFIAENSYERIQDDSRVVAAKQANKQMAIDFLDAYKLAAGRFQQ